MRSMTVCWTNLLRKFTGSFAYQGVRKRGALLITLR